MNKKDIQLGAVVLQQFASTLMFQLSDEQCQNLLLEFKAIEQQMEIVKNINTKDVLPMDYPLPIINTFLRSDTIIEPATTKSVLEIAPATKGNYIIINQVISNEN